MPRPFRIVLALFLAVFYLGLFGLLFLSAIRSGSVLFLLLVFFVAVIVTAGLIIAVVKHRK